MRRFTISAFVPIILVYLCCAISGVQASPSSPDPSIYIGKVTLPTKVQINGKTQYVIHYGSCVAVDLGMTPTKNDPNHHLLITAAHVVGSARGVIVTIQSRSFVATVLKKDDKQDVAYLMVPSNVKGLQSTPVSLLAYSYPDSYTAIGYAKDGLKKVSGKVSDWKDYQLHDRNPQGQDHVTNVTGMKFSGVCQPGMSGGGVFDPRGHLKGIVVARNNKMSVFIPWGKAIGGSDVNH